jgi:hypothetical protein
MRRTPDDPAFHTTTTSSIFIVSYDSPDWFLDELLCLLKTNHFISVHYTTIHRAFERMGLSTKQLKVIAAECSEPCRWDFARKVAPHPAEYLGFLDETSKNDKTPARRRGRTKKGKPAYKRRKFVCGRRLTAEALLTVHGIVLPLCSPFPGQLSVFVMGNARIDHGAEVLKLCERFGL